MTFLETVILNASQKEQIRALWNKEYPVNIMHKHPADFEKYLSNLVDHRHILIVDDNDNVEGWYTDFVREEARWFAMILATEIQGKGYGSELLKRGKANNTELNGWISNSPDYKKANGKPYRLPNEFYKKNGFEILPEIKFETPVLKTIKIKWRGN